MKDYVVDRVLNRFTYLDYKLGRLHSDEIFPTKNVLTMNQPVIVDNLFININLKTRR